MTNDNVFDTQHQKLFNCWQVQRDDQTMLRLSINNSCSIVGNDKETIITFVYNNESNSQ